MTNIKVIEKIGERPGKTTVILAGVHGNEICGIKALDELIPTTKITSGKVIFIYANLMAISEGKRQIEKNLNRCFLENQPKEIINTFEGKTAREIMPYLEESDAMLDLHASFTKKSVPFLIIDEKNLNLSNLFDTEIISFNWDNFEPGSTDYYMNLQNKPGICFECGYLGDNNSIQRAKEAILNFLRFSENIDGEVRLKESQRFLKLKSIYFNKDAPFKVINNLPDFWKANERTLIAKEGDKKVFLESREIVLFLANNENLNEECFLTAEETLINKENLTKPSKELK